MPKIAKKKKSRKLGRPKKQTPDLANDLFEIDRNPPPPGRQPTEILQVLFQRADRTIAELNNGEAFIFPIAHKTALKRHLDETYQEEKFTFAKVNGNDTVIRVYKFTLKKK